MSDKKKSKPLSLVDLAQAIVGKMGLSPRPATFEVDVEAPRPKAEEYNLPPGEMEKIWLGSRDERPTGIHIPPEDEGRAAPSGAGLTPNLRAAWEEAAEMWPYAARRVSHVLPNPSLKGTDVNASFKRDRNTITLNPDLEDQSREWILALIGHELAHSGQDTAFPSNLQNVTNYVEPFTPYRKRLGEDASFGVMQDIATRLIGRNNK